MLKRLHALPRLLVMRRLAWLALALLPLAAVVLAINGLADQHLRQTADSRASGWAQHIGHNVIDIDRVFMGERASPQTQEQLIALRSLSGMLGYRFFDPNGRLVLDSASLGSGPPAATPGQVLPAGVLAGVHHISLKHTGSSGGHQHVSAAYVPVAQRGKVIGVVEVSIDQTELATATKRSFHQAALIACAALGLVLVLGFALWRRRAGEVCAAQERALFLVQHDALCGALNRAHFHEALLKACAAQVAQLNLAGGAHIGAGRGLAVLHIDIDRFKAFNERFGQIAGDQLLKAVSARLQAVLRGKDVLARLGGDQFAVLQSGVLNSGDITTLAERLIAAVAQVPVPDGADWVVTASIGAAIHGVDGRNVQALTHAADLALLHAKSLGPGKYSFYDAVLDRQLQDRQALTEDLRQALAQGSLRLHFQPLFAAKGSRLTGYEALARWPHPTRGFVSPAEFIALAEQSGQIHALGRWVITAACTEAARWPGALTVAVNLSPAQFLREGAVVEEVRAALQASGLPAARLEVEITESLLMGDTEQVLRSLHALHKLGVKIAMDDFGTGYSSLAYLWRFPFDKLKIDRAFTQGLGSDAKVDVIVGSIIQLAHSLAMRVNAEGVETLQQQQALALHGCDEFQGFLLGRPQPPEKLAHLLLAVAKAGDSAAAVPA